jgi:hypothetical protein
VAASQSFHKRKGTRQRTNRTERREKEEERERAARRCGVWCVVGGRVCVVVVPTRILNGVYKVAGLLIFHSLHSPRKDNICLSNIFRKEESFPLCCSVVCGCGSCVCVCVKILIAV